MLDCIKSGRIRRTNATMEDVVDHKSCKKLPMLADTNSVNLLMIYSHKLMACHILYLIKVWKPEIQTY